MLPRESDSPAYEVKVIPRESYMTSDDWHATVTRKSDGKQLIFISDFLRLLRWKIRRTALDRAFARLDRHEARMARVEEYTT